MFGRKKPKKEVVRKYHGCGVKEMDKHISNLLNIENDVEYSNEELETLDIALCCIATVRNAMATDGRIIWDD